MDAKVYELLNDQINKELYSAYLYLSFADYYEEEGLEGFANWYEIQAQEERDHALIFRNYLHDNGCKVKLLAIDQPDKEFSAHIEPLEAALEHEKYVTSLINDIYAAALEASLKLKEISYIHSEAYAAGELKHGTISLVENGVLVVGVATQQDLFEKEISNLVEVKSRGASVLGLTSYGSYSMEDTADFTIYVPRTESCFATSLAVIPLQLLAYYISVARGLDVDKPRNLAKSVTVE